MHLILKRLEDPGSGEVCRVERVGTSSWRPRAGWELWNMEQSEGRLGGRGDKIWSVKMNKQTNPLVSLIFAHVNVCGF